jgi:hypothetical protein
MKFTYGSGQRPLDGYTLKRGIGKGGFGEVYYAVSDGGKEVALKLVRGQQQDVELRGVVQCLNLKHPNLINLFDLKTDAQGDRWVVMEYVAGEPLNVVLCRHQQGLPVELAQQWFVALAKAVSYLHDHGIVHRDLKPGNIFLENGTVKVGDYGLSKFISASHRTAQTQSVGTVHYMAPEISTGNYNKQIDIYAAGVILYEMLSGRVPFEGESAGEILMKHLTAPPDLTKLPPAFAPVVGKALAKNPTQRYSSMAEMARAAEMIGKAKPRAVEPARPAPLPPPAWPAAPAAPAVPVAEALPAVTPRGQVAELCGSLALSALFAAMAAIVLAALGRMNDATEVGSCFFLTVAVCWAVLVPAKLWAGKRGNAWYRRLVMTALGLMIGAGALWLEGYVPEVIPPDANGTVSLPAETVLISNNLPRAASALTYFGLAFFALRWWKMADRRRSHWFSLAPVLGAAFWAFLLLFVFESFRLVPIWPQVWRGLTALILASVIVQLVSPWEEPPPRAVRRVRLRYA